jgi:hypothetical protein
MIITSSNLQLNSTRAFETKRVKGTNKTTWDGSGIFQQNSFESMEKRSFEKYSGQNLISEEKEVFKGMKTKQSQKVKTMNEESDMTTIRQQILQYLWRLLFGDNEKKMHQVMEQFKPNSDLKQDFGGQEESFESYSELEETSFSTTGTIHTSDGRELSFDVQVHMSRSFMSYYGESTSYGASLVDPLVINTGSAVASVSAQSFYFDLDSDGTKEKINYLNEGSGFLALDRNEDGIINDGSELFGTRTGDGFADLALLDLDRNGFIDEADEVFSKLKIWYADGSDTPKLISLKEANIGAIYLGSASTNFSLMGGNNMPNAYIRNSGIFLYENGTVGTIQHVDMVKKEA